VRKASREETLLTAGDWGEEFGKRHKYWFNADKMYAQALASLEEEGAVIKRPNYNHRGTDLLPYEFKLTKYGLELYEREAALRAL
jgi:hypothetical protein